MAILVCNTLNWMLIDRLDDCCDHRHREAADLLGCVENAVDVQTVLTPRSGRMYCTSFGKILSDSTLILKVVSPRRY
jgi:hypothetical protein